MISNIEMMNERFSSTENNSYENFEPYNFGNETKLNPPRSTITKSSRVCKFYALGNCWKKASECPFQHSGNQPKQMILCKYYASGRCSKQERCQYLHSGFPCKFFHFGGGCGEGKGCRFSHDALTNFTRGILDKHLEEEVQIGGICVAGISDGDLASESRVDFDRFQNGDLPTENRVDYHPSHDGDLAAENRVDFPRPDSMSVIPSLMDLPVDCPVVSNQYDNGGSSILNHDDEIQHRDSPRKSPPRRNRRHRHSPSHKNELLQRKSLEFEEEKRFASSRSAYSRTRRTSDDFERRSNERSSRKERKHRRSPSERNRVSNIKVRRRSSPLYKVESSRENSSNFQHCNLHRTEFNPPTLNIQPFSNANLVSQNVPPTEVGENHPPADLLNMLVTLNPLNVGQQSPMLSCDIQLLNALNQQASALLLLNKNDNNTNNLSNKEFSTRCAHSNGQMSTEMSTSKMIPYKLVKLQTMNDDVSKNKRLAFFVKDLSRSDIMKDPRLRSFSISNLITQNRGGPSSSSNKRDPRQCR